MVDSFASRSTLDLAGPETLFVACSPGWWLERGHITNQSNPTTSSGQCGTTSDVVQILHWMSPPAQLRKRGERGCGGVRESLVEYADEKDKRWNDAKGCRAGI